MNLFFFWKKTLIRPNHEKHQLPLWKDVNLQRGDEGALTWSIWRTLAWPSPVSGPPRSTKNGPRGIPLWPPLGPRITSKPVVPGSTALRVEPPHGTSPVTRVVISGRVHGLDTHDPTPFKICNLHLPSPIDQEIRRLQSSSHADTSAPSSLRHLPCRPAIALSGSLWLTWRFFFSLSCFLGLSLHAVVP